MARQGNRVDRGEPDRSKDPFATNPLCAPAPGLTRLLKLEKPGYIHGPRGDGTLLCRGSIQALQLPAPPVERVPGALNRAAT
jgi:hypothetical protein